MKKLLLLFLLFSANWPAAEAIVFELKQAENLSTAPPFSGDSAAVSFQKKEPVAAPKKSSKGNWSDGLAGLAAFLLGATSGLCLLAFFVAGMSGSIGVGLIAAIFGATFLKKALNKRTEAEWRASQVAMLLLAPPLCLLWIFGMLTFVYLVIAAAILSILLILPMLLFIVLFASGRRRQKRGWVKKIFTWFPDLIGEFAGTWKTFREVRNSTKKSTKKRG